MDKHLTTKEAAAVLGVSRQRFYILAKRANVAPVGTVGERERRGRPGVIWLSNDIVRLADVHRRRLELLACAQRVEIEEPA